MTTIYLAGKMGKVQGACDCDHGDACHPHCYIEHVHGCGSEFWEDNWRHEILREKPHHGARIRFANGYTFGGPWFIQHDNHGLGSDARHIAQSCMDWIGQSDAVFAWLTHLDAYGTFAEIGYAKALRKPVFLAVDRSKLDADDELGFWFLKDLADGVCSVRNSRTGFAIFTHWLAARTAQARSSAPKWSRW